MTTHRLILHYAHIGYFVFDGPPNKHGERTWQVWKRQQKWPRNVPTEMRREIGRIHKENV